MQLLYRLNPSRLLSRRSPQTKDQYLEHFRSESEAGRSKERVTLEQGYKLAVAHFEDRFNAEIRQGSYQAEYFKGVEDVFRWLEAGREQAERAEESLKKYADQP
jgi:hypothetical protein